MRGARVMTTNRDEADTPTATPDEAAPGPGSTGAPAGIGWDPDTLPAAPPDVEHFARHLGETSGALFMYASMGGVFAQVGPAAYKLFRDRLMIAAGDPTDPIEVMLLEQVALAHFNIGRLHLRSAA